MPVAVSKKHLLWLLIFSQFAGTSLWFVINAILDGLPGIGPENYAELTSAVQLGFIAGTLLFSLFGIADRFPATKLFFFSSIVAAAANFLLLASGGQLLFIMSLRFLTGFFLAGIYPVGMKIAADFFPEKLGKALGFLVGALVLGTAFPHFVRSLGKGLAWQHVIVSASLLSLLGGCLVLFFFPKERKTIASKPFQLAAAFASFRSKPFRAAAFGYFGHMWELYAFWAILTLLFGAYNQSQSAGLPIYFWSFATIAVGSAGCALGGLVSQKWGSKKVAFISLLLSGICCLLAPLFFQLPAVFFLPLILFWGLTVTADSPQFSALVARFAGAANKGTSLTIVTCIGFSITIISIQFLKTLFQQYGAYSLWLLSAGPLFGLMALKRPT